GLYSTWGRFDAPTLFSLKPAVLLIIWVLVGSRSSLVGAFVGVVVVEGLTAWLGGSQGEYSPIYLGVALIAVVLVLPNGLVDSVARLAHRMRHPTTLEDDVAAPDGDHDPAAIEKLLTTQPAGLSADSLHKNFGGVAAVTDVSLDLASTGMTCVIGPNGAGKSTLLALLSGLARAGRGTIHLGQSEITAWTPARRARAGLALKMQVVGTFGELTVRENVRLASAVRGRRHATERVQLVADAFGMERWLDRGAAALSHGEQQRLDIAMAFATQPTVVLLDEPTAGLSATETERTAALLNVVARHAHVVVIDHDMTFIRMLAAPVVVMHLGRVLTAGEFHDVMGDQRVLDVYLGGGTHVAP
ncbi:MAG: ATP-binding cassette domain-containing protein, partial [Pseudonocardiaceae bacterium]